MTTLDRPVDGRPADLAIGAVADVTDATLAADLAVASYFASDLYAARSWCDRAVELGLADRVTARNRVSAVKCLLALADGELGQAAVQLEALLMQGPEPARHRGNTVGAMTVRERSILDLLPSHLSYAQIGQELFVSVNTVKSNLKSIYRKLGVATRSDAVSAARAAGLL